MHFADAKFTKNQSSYFDIPTLYLIYGPNIASQMNANDRAWVNAVLASDE